MRALEIMCTCRVCTPLGGGGGGGGDTATAAAATATAAVAAAGAVTAMKTTTDTTTTAAEVKTAATGWCVDATIEQSVKTTGLVFENTVFYSSFVISSMGFILPPPLPPPYRKQTKTHPINFEYFTLLFTISRVFIISISILSKSSLSSP
jgi:hypothetical protein